MGVFWVWRGRLGVGGGSGVSHSVSIDNSTGSLCLRGTAGGSPTPRDSVTTQHAAIPLPPCGRRSSMGTPPRRPSARSRSDGALQAVRSTGRFVEGGTACVAGSVPTCAGGVGRDSVVGWVVQWPKAGETGFRVGEGFCGDASSNAAAAADKTNVDPCRDIRPR